MIPSFTHVDATMLLIIKMRLDDYILSRVIRIQSFELGNISHHWQKAQYEGRGGR